MVPLRQNTLGYNRTRLRSVDKSVLVYLDGALRHRIIYKVLETEIIVTILAKRRK